MSVYKTSPEKPFHLSLAALPLNSEGKIACHFFKKIYQFENIYRFFVESIEPGESLENCLERGMLEEAGITAKVTKYLGSRAPVDTWFKEIHRPTPVQKTVLYFMADFIDYDESKRDPADPESASEIVFMTPAELKKGFQSQYERYKLEEFNEIELLERVEFQISKT